MNCCFGDSKDQDDYQYEAVSPKKVKTTTGKYTEWMTNLPEDATQISLAELKIPGSHDSFSYYLDKSGPIDASEPQWMKDLGNNPFIKDVVYNWSVTQHLNATEQLNAGIRYFDFRIARPPGAKIGDFRIDHGLYGLQVLDILKEFSQFLTDHPKEVVIMAFNGMENFDKECVYYLVQMLLNLFDSKMCPFQSINLNGVTLEYLWKGGYQIICMFIPTIPLSFPQEIWPGTVKTSDWPNTDDKTKMISFLDEHQRKRAQPLGLHGFYVTQGVMTENQDDILLHLFSTLEKTLSLPATQALVGWIKGFDKKNLFNLIFCDFVETNDFIQTVIEMNY